MPPTPDEIRIERVRAKLERTIFNTAAFWGLTSDQAVMVLEGLRDQVSRERRIGGHEWPAPRHAHYDPGTPDDELRAMAYEAVAAIAGQGITPSQRNVWAWLVQHGARKRQAVGLRIVQTVLSALSAGEVAAAVVRDVQGRGSVHTDRART